MADNKEEKKEGGGLFGAFFDFLRGLDKEEQENMKAWDRQQAEKERRDRDDD